ncbi:hypothetical protein Slu03_06950 [Sediminihabitans luteus]|nr:hypothetical protein Slu03_06950 [Sediminihabitans luteus]
MTGVTGERVRATARVVAVGAVLMAVADAFRCGNRWYVSTMFGGADSGDYMALDLAAGAFHAMVACLAWVCVALVAAAVGWRLRVVSARTP